MTEIAAITATIVFCSGWYMYTVVLQEARHFKSIAQNAERQLKYCEQCFRDALNDNARLRAKLHRDTPRASNGRFVKKGGGSDA